MVGFSHFSYHFYLHLIDISHSLNLFVMVASLWSFYDEFICSGRLSTIDCTCNWSSIYFELAVWLRRLIMWREWWIVGKKTISMISWFLTLFVRGFTRCQWCRHFFWRHVDVRIWKLVLFGSIFMLLQDHNRLQRLLQSCRSGRCTFFASICRKFMPLIRSFLRVNLLWWLLCWLYLVCWFPLVFICCSQRS